MAFVADVVSTDRLTAIEEYIADFENMRTWQMLSDAEDLSFVIDKILVKPDECIKVLWLDGSVNEYEIPKYTPKRGIE